MGGGIDSEIRGQKWAKEMNEVSEEFLLTDGEINQFLSSPSPEEEPIDWS